MFLNVKKERLHFVLSVAIPAKSNRSHKYAIVAKTECNVWISVRYDLIRRTLQHEPMK